MSKQPSETPTIFLEWMQAYGGIPKKVARSFTANSEDQRDLHQEMYLQLWRSLDTFAAQAKPSTWIYRVCLNTALTWRRTEKRRYCFLESPDLQEFFSAQHDSADEPQIEALYAAIRKLRPVDRALILLYLEERSYREISEIIGITETNTGVRLQRVKRELAQRLNKTHPHES